MMDRNSISPQLLRDVENYCNVTWRDDATDEIAPGTTLKIPAGGAQ